MTELTRRRDGGGACYSSFEGKLGYRSRDCPFRSRIRPWWLPSTVCCPRWNMNMNMNVNMNTEEYPSPIIITMSQSSIPSTGFVNSMVSMQLFNADAPKQPPNSFSSLVEGCLHKIYLPYAPDFTFIINLII